jgi:hypothetical protein
MTSPRKTLRRHPVSENVLRDLGGTVKHQALVMDFNDNFAAIAAALVSLPSRSRCYPARGLPHPG